MITHEKAQTYDLSNSLTRSIQAFGEDREALLKNNKPTDWVVYVDGDRKDLKPDEKREDIFDQYGDLQEAGKASIVQLEYQASR